MVQPGFAPSTQDSVGIDSAGPGSLIGFGSEITGDPRLAGEREWLVTNGLGGYYAMGTVSGAPSRSYHGLLIAALSPPVERTLLVSRLEVSVTAPDGSLTSLGHRQIEAFALEGCVPRWRFAVADALVEKRVWMVQGANTTYVSFRLVRGAGPLELMLTAFVQHRSRHGGGCPCRRKAASGAGGAHLFRRDRNLQCARERRRPLDDHPFPGGGHPHRGGGSGAAGFRGCGRPAHLCEPPGGGGGSGDDAPVHSHPGRPSDRGVQGAARPHGGVPAGGGEARWGEAAV